MIHKLALIAFLLTAALFGSSRAYGQWVSTSGPPGDVNALVFVGNTLFAGSSEGVFFLNPGDTSWSATDLDNYVHALVLSGGNLVAGTTIGIFFSNGLDTGWTQSDDSDNDFAFAALGSDIFASTDNGVFVSHDNGATWDTTNYGFGYPSYGLTSDGTNLFVGDYDGGVSLSADNGNTWTMVDNGLPSYNVNTFLVSGNNLFAGTAYDSGGVFLTTNNGTNWAPARTGLPDTTIINALFMSEPNLFAGTDSDVFVSSNNGATWHDVSGAMNDTTLYASSVSAYSFAANDGIIYIGTDRGVWMSQIPFFAGVGNSAPAGVSLTNYPNPFADKTTIKFSSPESGAAEITIVNILGLQVARLFDGELDAGEHEFSWNASAIAPGMYECVVELNGQVQRLPMIVNR